MARRFVLVAFAATLLAGCGIGTSQTAGSPKRSHVALAFAGTYGSWVFLDGREIDPTYGNPDDPFVSGWRVPTGFRSCVLQVAETVQVIGKSPVVITNVSLPRFVRGGQAVRSVVAVAGDATYGFKWPIPRLKRYSLSPGPKTAVIGLVIRLRDEPASFRISIVSVLVRYRAAGQLHTQAISVGPAFVRVAEPAQ